MDSNNEDEVIIATSTLLLGCATHESEDAKWQKKEEKPKNIGLSPGYPLGKL